MAAVVFRHFHHCVPLLLPAPHSLPSLSPLCSIPLPSSRPRTRAFSVSSSSSHASSPMDHSQKFMEFPFVSAPHRDLMVDLVSMIETRLDSQLGPDTLPPDVKYYHNQSGTAQGTLHSRSGLSSSKVDFILGSWLHCNLPTGGALNITSISAYLKASTDAPNFLIELIRSSPTSLVLILDLPPRKDLILHSEYLKTFYEDTRLDSLRQTLFKLPEVQLYFSPQLFIRCVISPTAIVIKIDTDAAGAGRIEEIIKDHISSAAKEALRIWLDQCACGERTVGEEERTYLEKRDELIKKRTIEIDLEKSLPRLFGPDVANRVIGVLREIYAV
ncbi:hypothetical protein SLEP1_g8185 [Rubroshorea leprosula]|uniref:Red chlorophyll catabolite reductase n=1 Tax=Rubroshorea leprosula TaxID=152421 RepID=A0AAV5IAP7_9ROSI|nr:hypothetical protein SLEP1_g8185 [Rubroshorea leprosula]